MKGLFIVLLMSLSYCASAEYNGWFLKLEIKTTTNRTIIGHIYRASAYLDQDSLTDVNYTTRVLGGTNNDAPNAAFTYFRNRITYSYVPYGSTDTAKIYTLLEDEKIPINEIKSISILQKIDFWYLSAISSEHVIEDTLWMKQTPIQKAIVDGYLCSWEVFIHEQTENTDQVLSALNALTEQNAKQMADLEQELKYADGEYYRKIEAQIEAVQEKRDDLASEILSKFRRERVVIISFCSC